MAAAFKAARTLLAAVELDVFTLLGDGPRHRGWLTGRAGLHDRAAADFLDALVALGLLERDGTSYRNGPDADLYLDRHKPTYIGGTMLRMSRHDYSSWSALPEALRTGEPATTAAPEPELLRLPVRELVERLDWQDVRRVVELGGPGTLVVQLAQAYPAISGGVLGADPEFAGAVERLFLSDRLAAYDGDWRSSPLPPAGVYVLSGLLSRLGATDRAALLAGVHGALPAGGRLIVRDTLLDDERRRNLAGLLGSLGLLLETAEGRQSTTAECRGWLHAAGFTEIKSEDLGYGQTAVIGRR